MKMKTILVYKIVQHFGGLIRIILISTSMMLAQEPSWVSDRPVSGSYFIGIGSVKKSDYKNYRQKAKTEALNDLASEISVSISSDLIDVVTEYSGFSEEYARNEIKISTSKELDGYERFDEFEDNDNYWIFYRLPKVYFKKYSEQALNYYENYLSIDEDDTVLKLELLIPCFVSVFKAIGHDVYFGDENNKIELRVEVRSQIRRVLGNIQLIAENKIFDANYGKGLESKLIVSAEDGKTGNPIQNLPLIFAFSKGEGDLTDIKVSTSLVGEASSSVSYFSSKKEIQSVKATVDLVDFKPNQSEDQYVDNVLKGISSVKAIEFIFNVSVLKQDIVGVVVVGSNLSLLLLEALTKNFNTEYKKKTDFIIMDYRQAKEIIDRENYNPTTCMGSECQIEIGKALGVDKLIFIDITYLSNSEIIDVATTMRNIGSLAVQESFNSKLKLKGDIDNFLLNHVPIFVDEFWNYINPSYINLVTQIPDVTVDIIPLNDPDIMIQSKALNVFNHRLIPTLYKLDFEKIGYENRSIVIRMEKGETYNRTIILKKKTKSKAFFKSLLIPGSGQNYLYDGRNQGRKTAALIFRIGVLTGVAVSGYSWTIYDESKKDYENAYLDYLDQTSAADIVSYKKIAVDKNNNMKDSQTLLISALTLTGLMWFSNALEAAFNFPDYGDSFSMDASIKTSTYNFAKNEPSITFNYNF